MEKMENDGSNNLVNSLLNKDRIWVRIRNYIYLVVCLIIFFILLLIINILLSIYLINLSRTVL